MSGTTRMEWTDATWNPVTGCTRVSPGCAHCYIERTPPFRMEGRRFTHGADGATTGVRLHPERLEQPLHWRKPRRVFVNSLSDLFHEDIPDEFIAQVFGAMAMATKHTFQVLTKRPERARDWFARVGNCEHGWITHDGTNPAGAYDGTGIVVAGDAWPLPNVWLGVSIENARFTWRADVLREIPAAVRFISAEPLLGSLVTLRGKDALPPLLDERNVAKPLDLSGIDWVIVGGESGPGARPMHPDWARELCDACLGFCSACDSDRGGVCGSCSDERPAFFFKQWGSWSPAGVGDITTTRISVGITSDGRTVSPAEAAEIPGAEIVCWRGTSGKSGGRHLDGRTWEEFPASVAVAA